MEECNVRITVDAEAIDKAIEKLKELSDLVRNIGTPYRCPICNGEGMIFPWMQTTSTAKETCNGCHGTGIVWSNG